MGVMDGQLPSLVVVQLCKDGLLDQHLFHFNAQIGWSLPHDAKGCYEELPYYLRKCGSHGENKLVSHPQQECRMAALRSRHTWRNLVGSPLPPIYVCRIGRGKGGGGGWRAASSHPLYCKQNPAWVYVYSHCDVIAAMEGLCGWNSDYC